MPAMRSRIHPKGPSGNRFEDFAPRFGSGSVATIERIRRDSLSYLEEFATEERPKMARRWDAKTRTCFRTDPKVKTRCRVGNQASYDRALVRRGDGTLRLAEEAIAAWRPEAVGRHGAQHLFSDLAIEAARTLRLVFYLPLRQTEGFLRSILELMDLDLQAPDHTTRSRRGRLRNVRPGRRWGGPRFTWASMGRAGSCRSV